MARKHRTEAPRWSVTYKLRNEDGFAIIVLALSEAFNESEDCWYCTLLVATPTKQMVRNIAGADELQAIEIGIRNLRMEERKVVSIYGLDLLNADTLEPEFSERELATYLSSKSPY